MHADLCGSRKLFILPEKVLKKLLTAESVGGCWLSLHVQLRYIFITLQYLNIEIDKSELSVPPSPPCPALLSPSTRSAHAVNVNARDYSNRWITGTIFPHFFSFLHFVCMNSTKPLRFRNI